MVISSIFSQLLPFKCILHYLTFIFYLPTIVIFCYLCSFGTTYLNRVLFCPSSIDLFTLFVTSILYSFYLILLLFDKYCQRVYKFRNTSFICHYLYQTLVTAIKSTMLQLFMLISFNISIQLFSNFLGTT